MTRVLVTGAGGQLGAELMRAATPPALEVVGTDRAALDIADRAAVRSVVADIRPDVIVNAAAYTAVDRAEQEPELAFAANADGVSHLVGAAREVDARLVHMSTDYVFDGTKSGWYVESDPVRPLGVYGESKAAGEQAARAHDRHLILRTSWVFGALGSSFVSTMLRLAAERDEIAVVDDQLGCPTSAADIAGAIVALLSETGGADELRGTFHLASPEAATWFQFARQILAPNIADGSLELRPLTTAEYPTPAARPANSRLDSGAIFAARGVRLPSWRESVKPVVHELLR